MNPVQKITPQMLLSQVANLSDSDKLMYIQNAFDGYKINVAQRALLRKNEDIDVTATLATFTDLIASLQATVTP